MNLVAINRYDNWTSYTTVASNLALNRWYTIRVDIDLEIDRYRIYVDDELQQIYKSRTKKDTLTHISFAQWENGLKDVDADRIAGVKSLAVVTNVKNNEKLYLAHPYFIYGLILKLGFILCCFIAFYYFNNTYYLLFLLIYGIPSQLYIMYSFLSKKNAITHRKTILFDVTFTAILGYSVIIGKTGIIPIILLILFLILGYIVGSAFQYNCEFKFRRFSKSV